LSDQELIDKFVRSGDNETVGQLYERYGHLVLGLCLKYLKNRDEARESTLLIFEKLLIDLKKHKISYFKSWLYVYSKNFCLMELRKRQSKLKNELEIQENQVILVDFNQDEHLKEKEAQIVLLEHAVALLSEDQKVCIELFYLQNKSYNEITVLTGLSPNDVKSKIQNGKRNLKLLMEQLQNERSRTY
jgi:RNA polymerase sigma-70 factor (ECF subfamily)